MLGLYQQHENLWILWKSQFTIVKHDTWTNRPYYYFVLFFSYFLYILSRIATHSIRCGLLLLVYSVVYLSVTLRVRVRQTWNWVIGSPGQLIIWVIFHARVTGSSFWPGVRPEYFRFSKKAQDKDIKIYIFFCENSSSRHWNIDI